MTQHPSDQLEDFVLHLLPEAVEKSVAEHLSVCALCRGRVETLEQTLGLLALAAPRLTPPEAAEDRLLQRVATLRRDEERSLGPAVATRRGRAGSLSASPRTSWFRASSAPASGAATWPSERWLSRAVAGLLAVAAALGLAVGLLGAQAHTLRQHNADLQQKLSAQQTVVSVIAAPGALVRQLAPTQPSARGAAGTMAMDPGTGRGVLLVSNLSALPRNQTYEFWIVQQQKTPAGETEQVNPITTFSIVSGEATQVEFSTHLSPSEVVNAGISVERAGGVEQPDSPMIMLFAS